MSKRRQPPVVIGWTEFVDFPDWGISGVRAKVDTGARSSALHVEKVEHLSGNRVAFDIVRNRKSTGRRRRVVAPISRVGRVRSSTGHTTTRTFVEAMVRLGPVERTVEISLIDRGSMIHRMLLGRTALSGPFIVDVSRRYVFGRPLRKKAARKKPA